MKKIHISYSELKRRNLVALCVWGTSEKFAATHNVGYIDVTGNGDNRRVEEIQAGRFGATLCCKKAEPFIVGISKQWNMYANRWEWHRTINGKTFGHFSKSYNSCKACAMANKDCFGVRIGVSFGSNFRWGINA